MITRCHRGESCPMTPFDISKSGFVWGTPDPRVPADVAAGEEDVDLSGGFDPNALTEHWSFQPITNPKTPAVQDVRWPTGTIDHFVLAELESAGIEPNPDADLRTRPAARVWI